MRIELAAETTPKGYVYVKMRVFDDLREVVAKSTFSFPTELAWGAFRRRMVEGSQSDIKLDISEREVSA